MKNIKVFYLLLPSLFFQSAWACRLDEPPHNAYQPRGKGVVYVQVDKEGDIALPGLNFKRLRRLPNLAIDDERLDEWEKEPPFTDLTTDYVVQGAQSTFSHYSYHSDGRYIVFAGNIMRNPAGTPPVDLPTFRAFDSFAVDKNSLYYEGKRTGDNSLDKPVDVATLRKVDFDSKWKPDWLGQILRDDRFLYVNGHRLEEPDSFTVLAQKTWDQRGKFSAAFNPCVEAPFGPWDTLARTRTQVIINGQPLKADPDTFAVVRWMPGSLLTFRDKNGQHRHVINQGNLKWDEDLSKHCNAFNLLETRVLWRKGPDCQQAEIPNLDPEQFHPVSDTVAQYQDRLYVITKSERGEKQLETVTLDTPNLTIDKRFNAGRGHGYLLTRNNDQTGLQVFKSVGPLILMDYRVPGEKEAHLNDHPYLRRWFARDDRYVYMFDGAQLWRYPTPDSKAVRVKWFNQHSGYGYGVRYRTGYLDGKLMDNGVFVPTGVKYSTTAQPVTANGDTRYDSPFEVGENGVYWRKRLSFLGQWGEWETLPGLDPKQFHPVSERIAQYQNRLYFARLSPFGEDSIVTLEMDSAAPFGKGRIHAGKEHGYFIRRTEYSEDVQVFPLYGQLKIAPRFAYDTRYVYTWRDNRLYQTASPCPAKTRSLDENMFFNNKDIIIPVHPKECAQ